jgi:hypothetical protein
MTVENNIIPRRTELLDKSGLISRPWDQFFYNKFDDIEKRLQLLEASVVSLEADVTLLQAGGIYYIIMPIDLVNIADGDILTSFTPGHAFRILSIEFFVSAAVTTALKASTINLEIGTIDITGGVVSLTSANCTPIGAKVSGTAITALNTGTSTDAISIEASSTTAFIEGSGYFLIKLKNTAIGG